jgi:hypothetical protein
MTVLDVAFLLGAIGGASIVAGFWLLVDSLFY